MQNVIQSTTEYVLCFMLRTSYTVRCAVYHALVLRLEFVELDASVTITVAGAIETAFELCVVVPGSIILGCARPA